jgi:hypothetical protein
MDESETLIGGESHEISGWSFGDNFFLGWGINLVCRHK